MATQKNRSMKTAERIIFSLENTISKAGPFCHRIGCFIKALFFGEFGIKLNHKRGVILTILFVAALLTLTASPNWLVWLGISLMIAGVFLWLIVIFSWTLDPLIDYKMRIHNIKSWGEKLLKYLSGRFKGLEDRHHLEASAWGKLAYFQELKGEVESFSKVHLLQAFLGRFFSTFLILGFGYAFVYYGLNRITERCFVSAAQEQGLAPFGSILDFIYYSAITIATVGYGDIYPIHPLAKLFVLTEILCGALVVIFLISSFTSISIHLTTERQKTLIGEIEKEIKEIEKIFCELQQICKEEK